MRGARTGGTNEEQYEEYCGDEMDEVISVDAHGHAARAVGVVSGVVEATFENSGIDGCDCKAEVKVWAPKHMELRCAPRSRRIDHKAPSVRWPMAFMSSKKKDTTQYLFAPLYQCGKSV